jgi:hypothetical protein
MLMPMELEPVVGKPVRFPPGRVAIRLDERHKSAYRRLYARYLSVLAGLPVLRERDFDGRAVNVPPWQLDALNRAFASLANPPVDGADSAFGQQEKARTRLFKRLQYLS